MSAISDYYAAIHEEPDQFHAKVYTVGVAAAARADKAERELAEMSAIKITLDLSERVCANCRLAWRVVHQCVPALHTEIKRLTAQLAEQVKLSTAISRDCNATGLERNALRDEAERWKRLYHADTVALQAELPAVRKDAERYRKLCALQKKKMIGPFYLDNHIGVDVNDLDANLDARNLECPECKGRGCCECGGSPQQE